MPNILGQHIYWYYQFDKQLAVLIIERYWVRLSFRVGDEMSNVTPAL